jgi:hypothetical protein
MYSDPKEKNSELTDWDVTLSDGLEDETFNLTDVIMPIQDDWDNTYGDLVMF